MICGLGLGLVVPYNKKEDLGWRDLGYTTQGLQGMIRVMKESEGDKAKIEGLLTLVL